MAIGPDSLITVKSVAPQAAWDKLEGTPLKPYTQLFIDLSNIYSIDLNWILSYLQWESGFGAANNIFSLLHQPWDMLCGFPPCSQYGGYSYPGFIDCRDPGNGYCYLNFDNNQNGIQAGYINWQGYVARGWTTWFTSLSVALCGNPAGCGSAWVNNVIAQGDLNSRTWPYIGPPPVCDPGYHWDGVQCVPDYVPPPPPELLLSGSGLVALGLGLLMVGGAYYVWKTNE